jgi:hypothetical protein
MVWTWLAGTGAVAPRNLIILLIQNGVHAASGGQPVTSRNLDFAALGRFANLKRADNIDSAEDLRAAPSSVLQAQGPSLLALATEPDIDVIAPPVCSVPGR